MSARIFGFEIDPVLEFDGQSKNVKLHAEVNSVEFLCCECDRSHRSELSECEFCFHAGFGSGTGYRSNFQESHLAHSLFAENFRCYCWQQRPSRLYYLSFLYVFTFSMFRYVEERAQRGGKLRSNYGGVTIQTPEEIHPLSAELSLLLPGQYFKVAVRSQSQSDSLSAPLQDSP